MDKVKLIFDCEDTLNKNSFLLDMVDGIELTMLSADNLLGIYVPPNGMVDAFVLKKLLSTPADVYAYRVLEVTDKTFKYKAISHGSSIYAKDRQSKIKTDDVLIYVEKKRYGVAIQMQLTNQCTRQCRWCPPYHKKPEEPAYLSDEVIDKIIMLINDHGPENFNSIRMGRISEATYDMERLYEVSKRFKETFPTIETSIVTNGDGIRSITFDEANEKLKYIDRVLMNDYDQENGTNQTKAMLLKYADSRGSDLHHNHLRTDVECWDLEHRISLDWDGGIMACCRTTKLSPDHNKFELGNILNINSWEEYDALRSSWSMIEACKYCVDSLQQNFRNRNKDTGEVTYHDSKSLEIYGKVIALVRQ